MTQAAIAAESFQMHLLNFNFIVALFLILNGLLGLLGLGLLKWLHL